MNPPSPHSGKCVRVLVLGGSATDGAGIFDFAARGAPEEKQARVHACTKHGGIANYSYTGQLEQLLNEHFPCTAEADPDKGDSADGEGGGEGAGEGAAGGGSDRRRQPAHVSGSTAARPPPAATPAAPRAPPCRRPRSAAGATWWRTGGGRCRGRCSGCRRRTPVAPGTRRSAGPSATARPARS